VRFQSLFPSKQDDVADFQSRVRRLDPKQLAIRNRGQHALAPGLKLKRKIAGGHLRSKLLKSSGLCAVSNR
jgi:hypothetical protein